MNDVTMSELGSVHGGQAGDCYFFGLKKWGLDIGIYVGDCEMPGSTP